jgi:hypothetical protein
VDEGQPHGEVEELDRTVLGKDPDRLVAVEHMVEGGLDREFGARRVRGP